MKPLHSHIAHRNSLLRWLFLAVLSVGILHFQEINDSRLNRTELVGACKHTNHNAGISSISQKSSNNSPTRFFSDCKNQQAEFLNILQRHLPALAIRRVTHFNPAIARGILSCQHFSSRSLSLEDSADFHS